MLHSCPRPFGLNLDRVAGFSLAQASFDTGWILDFPSGFWIKIKGTALQLSMLCVVALSYQHRFET